MTVGRLQGITVLFFTICYLRMACQKEALKEMISEERQKSVTATQRYTQVVNWS